MDIAWQSNVLFYYFCSTILMQPYTLFAIYRVMVDFVLLHIWVLLQKAWNLFFWLEGFHH